MRTPKYIFTFLTGVLFMHLVGRVWLELEGILPITSNILNYTLTTETNRSVIALNGFLLLLFAYFAFSHNWRRPKSPNPPRRVRAITRKGISVVVLAIGSILALGTFDRTAAQCIDGERGESKVIFDNASSYTSTFYVDWEEMATLAPHTASRAIIVSTGMRLLTASAVTDEGERYVFSANEFLPGKICVWHVIDSDRKNQEKRDWWRSL